MAQPDPCLPPWWLLEAQPCPGGCCCCCCLEEGTGCPDLTGSGSWAAAASRSLPAASLPGQPGECLLSSSPKLLLPLRWLSPGLRQQVAQARSQEGRPGNASQELLQPVGGSPGLRPGLRQGCCLPWLRQPVRGIPLLSQGRRQGSLGAATRRQEPGAREEAAADPQVAQPRAAQPSFFVYAFQSTSERPYTTRPGLIRLSLSPGRGGPRPNLSALTLPLVKCPGVLQGFPQPSKPRFSWQYCQNKWKPP